MMRPGLLGVSNCCCNLHISDALRGGVGGGGTALRFYRKHVSLIWLQRTLFHSASQGRILDLLHNVPKIKRRGIRVFSALTKTAEEERADAKPVIETSITGDAIRKRFLDFFADRGHKILPSSSLVPDDPTVLLTIAGMLQFKPIFLGQVPREVPRATTSQKCIRTNDIENVGKTARHHTFFEMLGNFSFGDYFKREAIKWAWELATNEFKLPVERLWVSVFRDDDEALAIWRDEVGVREDRIKRMGEEDNFWSSGPTGPCGPCSEMYYDFHPERGTLDVDLGDDSRFIEFYNLVFMQYNRKEDGSLVQLENRNIDTGLGLERLAMILQKVPNNYETDLIFPIIERAADLAGVDYLKSDEQRQTRLKVIGDHTRAVVYLISDGVTPSNVGRGYILRRLIRRVVRMGRLLGIRGNGLGDIEEAFLPEIAKVVLSLSSKVDPDVKSNASRISEELRREELRFVQTLERGEKLLDELLIEALSNANRNGMKKPCLSGKDVFTLYDTFGFPVEITEEVAAEQGVLVDLDGFEKEMEVQRKQSQAAHNVVKLSVGGGVMAELSANLSGTEFVGYDRLQTPAKVLKLLVKGVPVAEALEGEEVEVVLDKTTFYAEGGGQIGDHGVLSAQIEGVNQSDCSIQVKDVQKVGTSIFIHKGVIENGKIDLGASVEASVDSQLRKRAQAHHSATHLLQSALKKVLGNDTSQAGSLVAFDKLRFDFNFPRPLSDKEILEVEGLVNHWIGMAVPLRSQTMALSEAKKAGAIAMFGEKYGEEVRVIEVPGVSLELCGGTHVTNTAEIQAFKIVSEQGIASGIRRIEAVAGSASIEYMNSRDHVVKLLSSFLKVKVDDLPSRIADIVEEVKVVKNEAANLRTNLATMKADALMRNVLVHESTGSRYLVASLDDVDGSALMAAAKHLTSKLGDPSAIILGSVSNGKVNLVVSFSPRIVECGLHAGKFVGAVARICGGGGGGRPNYAQAGGNLPEKLPEALDKAKLDLAMALSGLS